tara:strand:- start:749 stop:970 length:222 start_codon:yes stop_codon:yes gene_type:complete
VFLVGCILSYHYVVYEGIHLIDSFLLVSGVQHFYRTFLFTVFLEVSFFKGFFMIGSFTLDLKLEKLVAGAPGK